MTDVVGKKMMELWDWIKQMVKDGIANLIPGGKAVINFAANTAKATGELTTYVADKSKAAYDKTKSVMGGMWDGIVSTSKSALSGVKNAYDTSQAYMTKKILGDLKVTPPKTKPDNAVKSSAASSISMEDTLRKGDYTISQKLYILDVQNNKYLRTIANNTTLLLSKSSGGGSKGDTTIMMSSQPESPTPRVNIQDNRNGYISSAYALG
jgi:hypothetical protein